MIPRELLKKLRKIEIYTARLASQELAGSYHSVFKGQGMAFAEVRQYTQGDDVRFIDWNVSARMNEPYVKIFTEEREITVMLVVDLSASGLFGKRAKIDVMAEIAALLAFSAIKNNDRVGLILFSDRVEKFIPPKKGRGHVMRVVSEVLNAKPEGTGTSIATGLERLSALKKKSVAFLISDFIDQSEMPKKGRRRHDLFPYQHQLGLAAGRHDLIGVEVRDQLERELPATGLTLVEDIETGELLELDFSDRKVRAYFTEAVLKEQAQRERAFQKRGVDYIRVNTEDDIVVPLTQLFKKRQRRLAGYR